MQPEESKQIIERFFRALDSLIESKRIRGISTFCRYHGINRGNLLKQRDDLDRALFKVSWLTPLVRYYGINPRWLLTGFGPMVKKRK
jgi:hypothetical protein